MDSQNLAQRLGYEATRRLLIINCDDLGSSHSANIATLKAMTEGVATSATLMVPCPWALEAARMFKGLAVGVHLTLTAEYYGYRWRGLTSGSSLHDRDGFLPSTTEQALRQLGADDARTECRAQIAQALDWGIDVTHLDAHMNVMMARVDLLEVYLQLAADFRLPVRLRSPQAENDQEFGAHERANALGILHNEHLVYPWPRNTRDVFFEEIPDLPAGVSEIFAHPVFDGDELRAYDRKNTKIRIADAACMTDRHVVELLDRNDIIRISFAALRDLQRNRSPAISGP